MSAVLDQALLLTSGNVLKLTFKDGTGVRTNVTSVASGGTWKVGAGSPVSFPVAPLVSDHTSCRWAQFVLSPRVARARVDDQDGSPNFTTAGAGWSATPTGGSIPSGYLLALGESFKSTTDGAGTATYLFSGQAAGSYMASAVIQFLTGADRTTDATYAVLNSDSSPAVLLSDGTTPAVFHLDQTSHSLPWDRTAHQAHWTDLGAFTTSGTGFSIVVSNAAGSSQTTLIDDAFARSNGAVGNGWVDLHGGIFSIASDTLLATADSTSHPQYTDHLLLRPIGEDCLDQLIAMDLPADVPVGSDMRCALLRYNRTTADRYQLTWTGASAIVEIVGIGGGILTVSPPTIPSGHAVRITLTATGTNPTTVAVTVEDTTAGTTIAAGSVTDSSATLQSAGGFGLGYAETTSGDLVTWTEVRTADPGSSPTRLVADGIRVETVLTRAVPLGTTTMTVSFPSSTFVTAAGTVPAIVDAPVTLVTDADVWAFNPAATRTMKVGYNLPYPDQPTQPSRFYYDLMRGTLGWNGNNFAVPPVGPDGNLNGPTTDAVGHTGGSSYAFVFGSGGNGEDQWGLLGAPDESIIRFEFTFIDNGEGTPVGTTTLSTGGGPVVFSDPGDGPPFNTPYLLPGGTRWALRGRQTQQNMPNPANWPGFVPTYTTGVAIQTTSQLTDVSCYDESYGTWTKLTHPVAYGRLHGRGFAALRFLEGMTIDNSNAVNWTDTPQPLSPGSPRAVNLCGAVGRLLQVSTVTSIGPVDLSGTDTQNALKWFGQALDIPSSKALILVTTASPHGLVTGQNPLLQKSDDGTAILDTYPTPDGGLIDFNFDSKAFLCLVVDATSFVAQVHYTGSQDHVWPPPTLASSHAQSNMTMALYASNGTPFAHQVQFAQECGVPLWINVPHLLTQAATTEMANIALAGTPPGQKVYVEVSNEPWNTFGFTQYYWFRSYAANLRYKLLNGITGGRDANTWMHGYAQVASERHQWFRDAWTNAGRDPTDVVRVMGTQAAGANTPTVQICDYCSEYGIGFELLAGDCYQDTTSVMDGHFVGEPAPALEHLDVDGILDVVGTATLDGGRGDQVAAHYAVLTDAKYSHAFDAVRFVNYEGGFQNLWATSDPDDAGDAAEQYRCQIIQSRSVIRHPRMKLLELARLQSLEAANVVLTNRYALGYTNNLNQPNGQAPESWHDYFSIAEDVGTGDPSENANPLDPRATLSQTGAGQRTWAGLTLTAATTYTAPASPTTITLGAATTATVTPNGPYTGTITGTPSGSAAAGLSAHTFTFSGDNTPQTFDWHPTVIGDLVIAWSNGGGLTDPADDTVTVNAGTGIVPILLNLYRRRRTG